MNDAGHDSCSRHERETRTQSRERQRQRRQRKSRVEREVWDQHTGNAGVAEIDVQFAEGGHSARYSGSDIALLANVTVHIPRTGVTKLRHQALTSLIVDVHNHHSRSIPHEQACRRLSQPRSSTGYHCNFVHQPSSSAAAIRSSQAAHVKLVL